MSCFDTYVGHWFSPFFFLLLKFEWANTRFLTYLKVIFSRDTHFPKKNKLISL